MMIIRKNKVMAKAIQQGAQLSRDKQFRLARHVLKNAGVCYFTIERILYEPHNIRITD
jgi:hypothetical protein